MKLCPSHTRVDRGQRDPLDSFLGSHSNQEYTYLRSHCSPPAGAGPPLRDPGSARTWPTLGLCLCQMRDPATLACTGLSRMFLHVFRGGPKTGGLKEPEGSSGHHATATLHLTLPEPGHPRSDVLSSKIGFKAGVTRVPNAGSRGYWVSCVPSQPWLRVSTGLLTP